MEFLIAIFFLGLMISLVVAKGILMANDYAASEREARNAGLPVLEWEKDQGFERVEG